MSKNKIRINKIRLHPNLEEKFRLKYFQNKSKSVKEDRKRNLFLSYRTGKEVQISVIANQFDKHPSIIINLLKNVGLTVSSEQDFVDKIFADSIALLFNSKAKNFDSSKTKKNHPQNSDFLVTENQIAQVNQTHSKQSQANIYKICPYCSATIKKIKKYDIHIRDKCPKREQSSNSNLSKQNNSLHKTLYSEDKIAQTKLVIEKVSWKLLPEGEWLFSELTNHFRRLSSTNKWKNKPFDEERLNKIEKSLKPNKCFIGKEEFDGYVVYCFNWTQKVLLECPIYGNAIYIIKSGKATWQEIAKATKWEARTKYSEQVTVINHSETWLERLEQNLRYGL